MKSSKTIIMIASACLVAVLTTLFVLRTSVSGMLIALVMVASCLLFLKISKHSTIKSIRKKTVMILMTCFAILYIGAFYIIGAIFNKFTNQPVTFSLGTILKYMLPLGATIISTEFIRQCLLANDLSIRCFGKKVNISPLIALMTGVLLDLLIYAKFYNLTEFDGFRAATLFVALSSLINNLLFNYITNRYGISSILAYRLITSLYVYIIPIVPDFDQYLRAFLKVLYPFIVYLIIDYAFGVSTHVVSRNSRIAISASIACSVVLMTLFTMLISCKFDYGALVIATDSMTGTFNRGTAVIYDAYKSQPITEGQVVLFRHNNIIVAHRVVRVEELPNGTHYITKGDANELNDDGYITNDDIVGLAKFGISYIGWPTLWLRGAFNHE